METEQKWFFREGAEVTGKVFQIKKHSAKSARWKTCRRCGGEGGAEVWRRTGWKCYQCGGKRGSTVTETVYTAEKLAKLEAAKQQRQQKKQEIAQKKAAEREAVRKAGVEAFMAQHGALVERAEACASKSGFISELLTKLETFLWTEKMIAAVEKTVTQIEETEKKKAASEFVGRLGERIELMVSCEYVVEFIGKSFYGEPIVKHFCCCRTEKGESVVLTGSGAQLLKGESGKVIGTVKEHAIYKGEKQTKLQRVKVSEVSYPEQPAE